MARTRGPGIDHAVASAVAVAVHVALAVWLLWWRDMDGPPQGRDEALQVAWIERPRPAVAATPPRDQSTSSDAAKPQAPRVPPETAPARIAAAPTAPSPSEPMPARPLSAVFIEQGRVLAQAQHGHDFTRNPLADAQAVRIDAAPERIRMKDPMTPAKVVAKIGVLFGGAGYETDPCPRIRRNLGNLATAGRDDEGLQEELRRHRQFCQQ